MTYIPSIIGTGITILISAFAGAVALMGLRTLFKRRRLMAALQTELIENHTRSHVISKKMGSPPMEHAFIRTPRTEFNRSVFDLIKTEDPILYTKITSHSDNITKTYRFLQGLEYIVHSEPIVYQKYDLNDPDGEQMSEAELNEMKQFVRDIIDDVNIHSKQGLVDIENYTNESMKRRILYWGCIKTGLRK